MTLVTGALPTGLRSSLLLHWRARDLSLNALSGQPGTFSRNNTQPVFDLAGQTISVGVHQPAFGPVDTDGDTVRDAMALVLGNAAESYWLLYEALPRSMTVYFRYVVSQITATNSYMVFLGGTADPHFGLRTNGVGSQILALYRNASHVDSATSGLTVALGDVVECCATLSAAGVCGLSIVRSGGAETFATPGGAQALPAAWADTKLSLGSIFGSSEFPMYALSLKIAAGVLTMQQMRDAF